MKLTETSTGIVCASVYEMRVLQNLIDNGVEFEYEPESYTYSTRVRNGYCGTCSERDVYQERSYTPDIRFANGDLLEIKGKFTPQKRSLMRAFVKCRSELNLRFLFQRDNWLTNSHKRKYSDFARAIGCDSATGTTVPRAWYS